MKGFFELWDKNKHRLGIRIALLGVLVVFLGGFLVWFIPALFGYIEVPQYIQVFGLQIRIYTILALLALTSALLVFQALKHFEPALTKIDEWEALLFMLIPGIFAARVYYVLSWPMEKISIIEMFKLDAGGLSIVGGMIGGLLGLFVYAQFRKLSLRVLLSALVIVMPLAQAIGRFGNFFNRELLGIPTGTLWGLYVPPLFRPGGYLQFDFFHPLFLYESMSNFALFALLIYLWNKLRREKKLTQAYKSLFFVKLYLAWYFAVRFALDLIRIDDSFRPYGYTYTQWLVFGVLSLIIVYSIWFQLQFKRERGVWFTDHSQLNKKITQKDDRK